MADTFRKIVVSPEQAAKKLRQLLEGTQPVEYVHKWRDYAKEEGIDAKHTKVQDAASIATLGTLKWSAWLAAGGAQFMLWLARVAMLDNAALRKLEKIYREMDISQKKVPDKKTGEIKQKKPNTLKKLAKKYPNLSAHLSYYMMLASVIGGGVGGYYGVDKISSIKKEKSSKNIDAPRLNYDAKFDASISVSDMVDLFWNSVGLGITELETYRTNPIKQKGEARYTRGPGLTWHYDYNEEGVLVQRANGPNLSVLSYDDNYNQARLHLIYETFKSIRANAQGKTNLTNRQVLGVALAGYQRSADIAGILLRINNAKTNQEVADAFRYFKKGTMPEEFVKGSLKRRWFCAAIAAGVIDVDDFIDMQRDAFSAVEVNSISGINNFKLDAVTSQYALSRFKSKSRNNTCREFLEGFDAGRLILADFVKGANNKEKVTEDKKPVLDLSLEAGVGKEEKESMNQLISGDKKYKAGKYVDAAKMYQKAIDIYPDNMEAYSSLALTYKKLGDLEKSLDYYEKCSETVKLGNERMNKNRSLLYDADVKATTYYNAGLAREAMAKIYEEAGNTELMRKNYDLAYRNFDTAYKNCIKGNADQKRLDIYTAAMKRVKKAKSGNKTAFVQARKNIEKKGADMDVVLYKTLHDDYTA